MVPNRSQRMSRIFICYRRDDSAGFARALKTVLSERFGKDHVFMDLDNIDPGEQWEDVIHTAVSGWTAASSTNTPSVPSSMPPTTIKTTPCRRDETVGVSMAPLWPAPTILQSAYF